LFALGVPFTLVGLGLLIRNVRRRWTRTAARAVVVQVLSPEQQDPARRFTTTVALVEFLDTGGGKRRGVLPPQGDEPYREGTGVRVLFDPRNPEDVEDGSVGVLWLIPVLFAGLGCLTLALGVALIVGNLEIGGPLGNS